MARLKGTIAGPPIYPVGYTLDGYWHTLKMDKYGAVIAGPAGSLGEACLIGWADVSPGSDWVWRDILSVTTSRVLEVRTVSVLHTAASSGSIEIHLRRVDASCAIARFRDLPGQTAVNWTGCVYLTNGTKLQVAFQMPGAGVTVFVDVCAYWHEYEAVEEA